MDAWFRGWQGRVETACLSMNQIKQSALIVEDNPDDVLFLEHALNGRFNTCIVSTLALAVIQLKQRVPHVILLDLELPDSHFPDTLPKILPVADSAAIVIVSGRGDEDFVQRCIDEGAHGFLPKDRLPFTDIATEIEKAIAESIIRRAHRAMGKLIQQRKTT